MKSAKFKVSSPQKLLSFLREQCPEYGSVKAIKRAIDSKLCKVNGRVETFSTHPLKMGDTVDLRWAEAPLSLPLDLLYENEDFLIYNKPPQMVSTAPPGLHLVHRLDKETSGAWLLAKTSQAERTLSALFANRKMEKHYLAIVDGEVEEERFTIDNYLGLKHTYQGGSIYGAVSPIKGKRAITFFECLKRGKEASLLLCKPQTGRTHQIRSHLAGIGHPIVGDWQYARKFRCSYESSRHLLHASKLKVTHNTITAPLFEDFIHAQNTLFDFDR